MKMCTEILTRHDCEVLSRNLSREPKTLISYSLKSYKEIPAGFLGEHYRLLLNFEDETVNFFVKALPNVKTHSEYVNNIGAFKKETSLNKYLLPKLQESVHQLWSAKCYLVRDDLLVFEDLSVKGYYEPETVFDFEHCAASLKTLANFHASSVIWELENGHTIQQTYGDVVKETTYVEEIGTSRYFWLQSTTKALFFITKKMGLTLNEERFADTVRKSVLNLGPIPYSCNVLSHGDLWVNNFMFRRTEDAIDAILVDFQLARYAPCAIDLMCCIYLTTSEQLRSNLSQLIEIYYRQFRAVLNSRKIDADRVLTFDRLVEDCSKYRRTAITETLLYGLTIWVPAELAKTALGSPTKFQEFMLGDRTPLINEAYETDDFFKMQMTKMINELLEYY